MKGNSFLQLKHAKEDSFLGLSLKNQVALVTGAGSGMGLAAAQAFAAEGAAVALVDINESAVGTATERLIAAGHKAIGIRRDVTDEAQVKAMVEQTVSAFGHFIFQQLGASTGYAVSPT